MQRALFLIEATGERISALLNPERLVLYRRSGVETLRHASGTVTGGALSDDLVLATGGGSTELVLDLLFDVDLSETGQPTTTAVADPMDGAPAAGAVRPVVEQPIADVRELTRPLWNLSESVSVSNRRARLPIVRFIWGRSWNMPGVVTDVAERFERFDEEGRPRRSFLRLKFRRIAQPDAEPAHDFGSSEQRGSVTPFFEFPGAEQSRAVEAADRVELPVDDDGMPSVPFYQLSAMKFGDPALWRLITVFNAVDNPFHLEAGTLIALPTLPGGGGK